MLAPNHRPIQITDNLENFWRESYPKLKKELQRKNEPVLEAIAFQGQGVFETLKEIARQVLVELKQGS